MSGRIGLIAAAVVLLTACSSPDSNEDPTPRDMSSRDMSLQDMSGADGGEDMASADRCPVEVVPAMTPLVVRDAETRRPQDVVAIADGWAIGLVRDPTTLLFEVGEVDSAVAAFQATLPVVDVCDRSIAPTFYVGQGVALTPTPDAQVIEPAEVMADALKLWAKLPDGWVMVRRGAMLTAERIDDLDELGTGAELALDATASIYALAHTPDRAVLMRTVPTLEAILTLELDAPLTEVSLTDPMVLLDSAGTVRAIPYEYDTTGDVGTLQATVVATGVLDIEVDKGIWMLQPGGQIERYDSASQTSTRLPPVSSATQRAHFMPGSGDDEGWVLTLAGSPGCPDWGEPCRAELVDAGTGDVLLTGAGEELRLEGVIASTRTLTGFLVVIRDDEGLRAVALDPRARDLIEVGSRQELTGALDLARSQVTRGAIVLGFAEHSVVVTASGLERLDGVWMPRRTNALTLEVVEQCEALPCSRYRILEWGRTERIEPEMLLIGNDSATPGVSPRDPETITLTNVDGEEDIIVSAPDARVLYTPHEAPCLLYTNRALKVPGEAPRFLLSCGVTVPE